MSTPPVIRRRTRRTLLLVTRADKYFKQRLAEILGYAKKPGSPSTSKG